MTIPKDDWKPVSLIMDSPNRTAGLQTIAREVTEYARDYSQSKKRTAAGVSSILDFGGPAGSSIPSVLAQNSAISSFLYSLSRADKLQLFRYWCRHDPMVGQAIDLHTQLPMSRVTIGPPKGPSPRQNKDITRIYESMCERLNIMELLPEITTEYHMCFDMNSHIKTGDATSRRIGDIQVGDLVLTGKGRLRPVMGIRERDIQEEICIIKARGLISPLRVTKEHILFTVDGEKKAGDVTPGDKLYFNPPQEEISQKDLTDGHCFLMGWYLAEGSLRENGSTVRFSLFRGKELDQKAIPEIKKLLEDLFPPEISWDNQIDSKWNGEKRLSSRIVALRGNYRDGCSCCGAPNEWVGNHGEFSNGKFRYQCYFCGVSFGVEEKPLNLPYEEDIHGGSCVNITYNNRKAYAFFLKEGGRYSPHKKLEGRWLYLPKGQQRILVDCWLDGDGSVGGDRETTIGVTTSYNLFEQIYWIMTRLGINPRAFTLLDGKNVEARDVREIHYKDRDPGKYNRSVLIAYNLSVSVREYIECIKGEIYWYDKLFEDLKHKWSLVNEVQEIDDSYQHPDKDFSEAVRNRYSFEGWRGISRDFGYSQGTISRVAVKIGVKGTSGVFWTDEKRQFLVDNYEKYGASLLEKLWGKSSHNIQLIAAKMGLRSSARRKIDFSWDRPLSDGRITLEVKNVAFEYYEGKVRDLMVNEDNSYVVENSTVHNCGDVYTWCSWNPELLEYDEVYCLPVEYVHSIIHPFNRKKEIIFFAKPLVDTAAIRRITDRDLYLVADSDIERLYESLGDSVPEELKEALNYGEAVPLNTNWKYGSYCKHIYRNRPPNEEYGISILERCMDTLLRLENLKNANFSISSRNMNPKHLVAAPGVSKSQLDDLRAQLDLSFLETADYSIVTNYEVIYQLIGASDRLLNTDSEYQTLRQDLATGLGTTVDMLTGAATYGGQRITLEIMNTQYLCLRDKIKTFVEKDLFRPVAFAKGHYFEEEIEMWPRVRSEDIEEGDILIEERDGHLRRKRNQVNVIWLHSTLRFNRVSIRDNAEVYDQLFQLHQKGSLAVRYLLDLHNIDPEENSQAMLEDIGTPKDSVFNDFVRALYTATDVPQKIISQTDFVDRIMRGLKLGYKQQPQMGAGGGMGGGMGGGLSDMGGLGGGLGGGMGGGLGGGMGGEMPGMGPESGMIPGGVPGDTGGVPGGPAVGGAPGAVPVASSRGRRRTAAQVRRDQEISGPSLPGRVLSSKTSEVLRKIAKSKNREGVVLSSKEVKSLVQAIEVEEEKREDIKTKKNKKP